MKLGTSVRFLFPTSPATHERFRGLLASTPKGAFIERPMGAYAPDEQARNLMEVASAARAAGLDALLTGDERGIWHLGAPRANTLYQIAQVINRVGDYDSQLLKGCPRLEAGPMPPRAGNVSMNSAKLLRLFGKQPFRPWPLGDDLMPTRRDWHCERPVDELRSLEEIARRLYRYPALSTTA